MNRKKIKILSLLLLFSSFMVFNSFFTLGLGRKVEGLGSSYMDHINSNENVSYYFENNRIFEISVNQSIDLSIDYNNQVINRQTKFIVDNDESISLNISSKASINGYGLSPIPINPMQNNYHVQYRYNCIYKIHSNHSINNLTIQYIKNSGYGLLNNLRYALAVYKLTQDSWELKDTIELMNESSSEIYLESSLLNLEGNVDYYLTLYEIQEVDDNWFWPVFIIIFSICVGAVSIAIVISKKEYIQYLMKRNVIVETGAHRLSLEDVLDNENRNKIIDFILEEPGIHFNELLRKTELAAGNLVWHLEILCKYKIIGKKDIGRYVSYFPYYQKNPISNIDLKLKKSKLTLMILEMIEKKPGIWNNVITKQLKLDHKTISYHVNKLIDLDLIFIKKEGRKRKFYPNLDSEYFNGDSIF